MHSHFEKLWLDLPELGGYFPVPAIGAKVDQIHDARNAVSATVSVLKGSVAIFRPTSSKVSVQKVLLCAFHCKPKLSQSKFRLPGTGKYPQVPRNRSENGQNHDARKPISATLSVLSEVRLYFGPEAHFT